MERSEDNEQGLEGDAKPHNGHRLRCRETEPPAETKKDGKRDGDYQVLLVLLSMLCLVGADFSFLATLSEDRDDDDDKDDPVEEVDQHEGR